MDLPPIYLGTILLESNRWAKNRLPTYRVSDWIHRIAAAGFDGIELWENHILTCSSAERDALRTGPLPVAVFNSYASLGGSGESARRQASLLARELGAKAMKFNVSADAAALREELRTCSDWAAMTPNVDFLCECHAGTSMDSAEVAAAALADYANIGVIVHPFSCPDLRVWLRHLGSRIRHAHVQVVDSKSRRSRIRDHPAMVHERLTILREAGFCGTFCIEFTAGVGAPPEDREALFTSACDDLAFLRQSLEEIGALQSR